MSIVIIISSQVNPQHQGAVKVIGREAIFGSLDLLVETENSKTSSLIDGLFPANQKNGPMIIEHFQAGFIKVDLALIIHFGM